VERWVPWGTQRQKQLLAAGDVGVAALSLLAGVLVQGIGAGGLPALATSSGLLLLIGTLIPAQIAAMYVLELYEMSRPLRATMVVATVLATIGAVALASSLLLLFGFLPPAIASVAVYGVGFCIGSFVWRLWVLKRWRPRATRERVLVLGGRDRTGRLCDELRCRPGSYEDFYWVPWIGAGDSELDPDMVVAFAAREGIDTATYPWALRAHRSFGDTVSKLRRAGIPVCSFPGFFASRADRIPLEAIDVSWVNETVETTRAAQPFSRTRKVLEALAAGVLGIFLSPFVLLIAAIIKLESRGPVFFVQERLGHLEKPFRVYKFRTMIQNAERHSGPVWAVPEDSRITRVGGFLRATGLDELPQLINIVRGEMSFVGTRPIRRHFADKIADEVPFYWHRFLVSPGITGWAQVMHDYAGSVEGQRRKLEYELFYLRYASLTLDFAILLKTVKTVLFRRVGAFLESPRPGVEAPPVSLATPGRPDADADEEPARILEHVSR
jgi:lipopolysaccharide/colanic/teichoic acid biosynthesis glycosyltransferase